MGEPGDGRSPIERALTRRGFLVGASAGALTAAGLLEVTRALAATAETLASTGPALLPSSAVVRSTMSAYADTIVPGPAGGADPAPGAVEAGVVDVIYDPFYEVAPGFPAIHEDLQSATPRVLGRPASFDLALPYRDRERVVLERMTAHGDGGEDPLGLAYSLIAVLVYFGYYGTAGSELGLRYIGLPPHSDGYWPHHSYGVRFRGMTRNGNPR